jgi:hypothetical protein
VALSSNLDDPAGKMADDIAANFRALMRGWRRLSPRRSLAS